MDVPRVRDTEACAERPLESYQAMERAHVPKELTDALLLGLAQGDYERVAGQFIDRVGLSQSNRRNFCGSVAALPNGPKRHWRPLSVARWPRRPTSRPGSMSSMWPGSR